MNVQDTLIHELGHALDYRTNRSLKETGDLFNLPVIRLVAERQQNFTNQSDMTECVADHFLNWAQCSYRADTDPIDPDTYPGDDESIQVVKTIPAYWMGNITVPVSNVDLGPSSGIANWASVATKYSQILQSLELYLKLGMFDEVGINAPV